MHKICIGALKLAVTPPGWISRRNRKSFRGDSQRAVMHHSKMILWMGIEATLPASLTEVSSTVRCTVWQLASQLSWAPTSFSKCTNATRCQTTSKEHEQPVHWPVLVKFATAARISLTFRIAKALSFLSFLMYAAKFHNFFSHIHVWYHQIDPLNKAIFYIKTLTSSSLTIFKSLSN